VALLPNRRSVLVLAGAQQPVPTAEPLPRAVPSSVALREGHD
jgi:hypothetical protein